jgi:hypothetical protein
MDRLINWFMGRASKHSQAPKAPQIANQSDVKLVLLGDGSRMSGIKGTKSSAPWPRCAAALRSAAATRASWCCSITSTARRSRARAAVRNKKAAPDAEGLCTGTGRRSPTKRTWAPTRSTGGDGRHGSSTGTTEQHGDVEEDAPRGAAYPQTWHVCLGLRARHSTDRQLIVPPTPSGEVGLTGRAREWRSRQHFLSATAKLQQRMR